jgi:hypothetical protein
VLAIFCIWQFVPWSIWYGGLFYLQKVLCELWMIMCFLVTLICDLFFNLWEQSTGTFIAASRFGSATPVPPSVLSRGVGWLVLRHYFMIYTSIISAFTYWELDSCWSLMISGCRHSSRWPFWRSHWICCISVHFLALKKSSH